MRTLHAFLVWLTYIDKFDVFGVDESQRRSEVLDTLYLVPGTSVEAANFARFGEHLEQRDAIHRLGLSPSRPLSFSTLLSFLAGDR